jgi:transcription elongation factor Elf1
MTGPQYARHRPCPRCGKQAIVLVTIKSDTRFYRDTMGNTQYHCINCHTTFSVGRNGQVTTIKPEF